MRAVAYDRRQPIPTVLLDDVDADGHLDAVLTRMSYDNGGVVIYGPLWQWFEQASSKVLSFSGPR
jgi:hypothetical protein